MADQPPADVVVDGDQEIAAVRARDGGAYLVGECGAHALVGVDLENPVAGAGVDSGVPPVAFQGPGALDDQGGVPLRDRPRAVGAAVENDHPLVGEREGAETVVELRLLVVRDHQGRERRPGHRAVVSRIVHVPPTPDSSGNRPPANPDTGAFSVRPRLASAMRAFFLALGKPAGSVPWRPEQRKATSRRSTSSP